MSTVPRGSRTTCPFPGRVIADRDAVRGFIHLSRRFRASLISICTAEISVTSASAPGLPRSARTAPSISPEFSASIAAMALSCPLRHSTGLVTPARKASVTAAACSSGVVSTVVSTGSTVSVAGYSLLTGTILSSRPWRPGPPRYGGNGRPCAAIASSR